MPPGAGQIITSGGMALATVGGMELFADVGRMNKFSHPSTRGNVLLNLSQNIVTVVAVL